MLTPQLGHGESDALSIPSSPAQWLADASSSCLVRARFFQEAVQFLLAALEAIERRIASQLLYRPKDQYAAPLAEHNVTGIAFPDESFTVMPWSCSVVPMLPEPTRPEDAGSGQGLPASQS
jgi:hypothetical protein